MVDASAVVLDETVTTDLLKPKKKSASKVPTSAKEALAQVLVGFNIEEHKRPWMATKTFRLITTEADLERWVDKVIANKNGYRRNPKGELVPVVAVDTETTGLDIRIVKGKLNVDIAGVCLSADGVEGVYLPITHRDFFVDRVVASRHLQRLFDVAHLVFFNAKFDREILRVTMGIKFRPWPHFEDVQIFNYLLDPKADVSDKKGSMAQGGLKALSEKHLGMEQIELGDFTKVKVKMLNKDTGKYGNRTVYAPFNLVPCDIALWYAASDGIVTWLLWELMHEGARKLTLPMIIDHELVDSLSWMERQRYNVNEDHLKRTIRWQQAKLEVIRKELAEMTGIEDFNPGSTAQLGKVLFEDKGLKPYKVSDKTGIPSTDAESLEELKKQAPNDPFLEKLFEYREYAALHPESLKYDPRDLSAKIQLKQTSVAGGRLSANGGEYDKDGGCGLNIQAIKSVSGNKWVKARLIAEEFDDIDPEGVPEASLDEVNQDFVHTVDEQYPNPDYLEPLEDFNQEQIEATEKLNEGVPKFLTRKVRKVKVRNIKNHLVSLLGYTYCIVPNCPHCKEHFTVLKDSAKADLNEILNLRSLFVANSGWTFFTIDYSNIEMRCAANISREPKFIDEFMLGEGDFHTLTAIVVFGDKFTKETDKGKKKELRGIAKILNFALLYGGTEHTIYESLKKIMPNVTIQDAKDMVTAYWEGVPVFKAWVARQCDIAQNDFYTKTGTGRIIGFKSAMEQMGIYEPLESEDEAYREYQKARKKAREFEALANDLRDEKAELYEIQDARKRSTRYYNMAQALWKDTSTGVRNYCDYNKFVGKIGRLSMNIPLQGLAGDFMRMALNEIRKWVMEVGLEGAVRIHGSVHDEVDPSVKNEYCPFVIPRIAKLMKLRELHEERGWPVPIETDAEYGQSWNIEFHLTGDKDHKPSAWYDIPGMQSYIPIEWYDEFHENLVPRLETPESRAKLCRGLRKAVHERAHNGIDLVEKSETPEEAKKWLTITLQLDEYWRIDSGEEPCSLEDYEAFYGLTRPEVPVGGFLDGVPLDLLADYERERLEALLREDEEEEAAKAEGETPEPPKAKKPRKKQEVILEASEEVVSTLEETENRPLVEDSVFAEQPKKKTKAPAPTPQEVAPSDPTSTPLPEDVEVEDGVRVRVQYAPTLQCLRFLDEEDLESFMSLIGRGNKTLTVVYCGEVYEIPNVGTAQIPEGYGYSIDELERINESAQEPGAESFRFED